jgi:hypothetical protein
MTIRKFWSSCEEVNHSQIILAICMKKIKTLNFSAQYVHCFNPMKARCILQIITLISQFWSTACTYNSTSISLYCLLNSCTRLCKVNSSEASFNEISNQIFHWLSDPGHYTKWLQTCSARSYNLALNELLASCLKQRWTSNVIQNLIPHSHIINFFHCITQ